MDIIRSLIIVSSDYYERIPHLKRQIARFIAAFLVAAAPVIMVTIIIEPDYNPVRWCLWILVALVWYFLVMFSLCAAAEFVDWTRCVKKPCTRATFTEYMDIKKKLGIGMILNSSLTELDMNTYETVLKEKVKKAMEVT